MHRIDTPTAQKDKFGAGKNGFTRGNPQTGTPATELDDDYFDALQEEIVGVIEAAAIQLDKSDRGQLLKAMKKHFQASDKTLAALAGLLTGANKLPYFTGNDTVDQTDLTQVGRDIIGKATVSDVIAYLELEETKKLAANAVPSTRSINNHRLSNDIMLTAGDVGAMPVNAELPLLGVGQRYLDLSSAGMLTNVYYTNTHKSPILVIITPNNQNGVERSVAVDDVEICKIIATSNADQPYPISFVVPSGSKYKVVTTGTIMKWVVLQ
ncbi:hypothetical protein ACVQ8M_05235 [Edwardsiella tarda]